MGVADDFSSASEDAKEYTSKNEPKLEPTKHLQIRSTLMRLGSRPTSVKEVEGKRGRYKRSMPSMEKYTYLDGVNG